MKQLRCVKGMHDILPEEMPKWHFLEDCFRELVDRYCYQEIRTPFLEPLDLFVRGIGEATDIVEKEMYAFQDKGGANLALRPEGTASVIRAYVQHSLEAKQPISKLYYIGPMFRRERPAKGRYRQFFQAGAELIGAPEPSADAEIIQMAVQFVEMLGICNVQVQLNSLGDSDTRPKYKEALVSFFSTRLDDLCNDCKRRIETNPLRILDCKVEACKKASENAPCVLDYLSDESAEHFQALQQLLEASGTSFAVVPRMVRGLDYYTRTIFEIQGDSGDLGSQATIVGGGRYNGLVKELGGRSTSTIGFAFGLERLLLMMGDSAKEKKRGSVFVAGVGEGGTERASKISRELRKIGFKIEMPYRTGSLRSQLKRADKSGALYAIIAGDDEATRESVTWRNMKTGEQNEVSIGSLAALIKEIK